MDPIALIPVVVVLALAAFAVYKLRKDHGTSNKPGSTPYIPPVTTPQPQPKAPDAPTASPSDYGPDSKGRIRIPEVEALGGDWARTWWLAPWMVPQVGGDTLAGWIIRGNCGVNADGTLAPHSGYGFEPQPGDPPTPYSWMVPHDYAPGIDEAGRHQVAIRQAALLTDKLTRSTRATSVAELVVYLRAHPEIKPIPDYTPSTSLPHA